MTHFLETPTEHKPTHSLYSRPRIIGLAMLVVLVAGVVLLAILHHSTPVSTHPAASKHSSAAVKAKPKPSSTAPTSNTSSASTPPPQQAPATNAACKLLSQTVAQQLVGATAQTTTPTATSATPTADTAVAACAYSAAANSATQTIQLTVRSPKNSLGTSENATAFGSERPSGAITVSGYGQAAYWDPGATTLNILRNNNWYVIGRSGGTQSNTQAAASALGLGS